MKGVFSMKNSIANMRPHLVNEWSDRNLPLSPNDVPYGSNKLYWWNGPCGHEWETSAKARSAGEKCPICSGARVIAGVNDLNTTFPSLAEEWSSKNKIKPTEVSAGSHKKVLWHGKCGHEWTAEVKSRVNGTGCPYCSHNIVLPGFNDLASRFPKLAAEWSERNYPLYPNMVTAFKNKKVWWKCSLGHEWYTLISTRAGGSQCPYCSGIKLLKGFNDLATTHPTITEEWSEHNFPLSPDQVNAKSTKNVWWKCKACGNEWKSVISARVKGTSCPVCAERQVLRGHNDLATTDYMLCKEWDYEKNKVSPTEISRNSHSRVWWLCRYGHSWNAKICERTHEDKTCSVCESEFDSLLVQLLVSLYAKQYNMRVVTFDDNIIGLLVETYIPDIFSVIERMNKRSGNENERVVKEHLCKMNGISYYEVSANNHYELADKIKKMFQKKNIYILSNSQEDIEKCKKAFFKWKDITQQ